MPRKNQFKVTGTKQAIKNINAFAEQFGGSKARRVIASALSKATTPAFRSMKLAAPRGYRAHKSWRGNTIPPGNIPWATRKRRGTTKDGNQFNEIGVIEDWWYAVFILPSGHSGKTGTVAPNDWFFKVFADHEGQAVKIFQNELIPQMRRAAKRLSAKQK